MTVDANAYAREAEMATLPSDGRSHDNTRALDPVFQAQSRTACHASPPLGTHTKIGITCDARQEARALVVAISQGGSYWR